MMRQKLGKTIREAIAELGFKESEEVPLEHPENPEHGDYATSVAFVLAKEFKKNPQEIAEGIASRFTRHPSELFDKVEAVGGFVNFYLAQEVLEASLLTVLQEKDEYGRGEALEKKKVMVEFTDPNPFKEFHIGHLYSNVVGESLSRLLEAQGAQVKRANYQGDVGLHVAKAVWGMKNALNHKMPEDRASLDEKARWLGMCYAAGALAYEKDERAKEEIGELNKKIFAKDKEIQELYEKGRKWSLQKFEEMYKRLGTKFDYYYFERDSAKKGLEIVKDNLKKGIFKESQGAVIFPGDKYGLHSRVFINSQGLPTYEAKELGLAPTKYKDFKYDQSVIITGNEINEYFKVLIAALKQINPELGEKTVHLSHGMVRLPEGKMSSRTGNVVTGEWLLNEVREQALVLDNDLEEKERSEIAERVAIAAVKYSFLRVGIGRDIIFDFEESLNLQGESGPYIQYTYARCKSILRKSQIPNPKFQINLKFQISKEETDILRTLYRFPEVAQQAAEKYAPNLVCAFAFDVAQAYNAFYGKHRVIEADTKDQKQFRLLLTAATAQVLKNSLFLLGIQAPEKM